MPVGRLLHARARHAVAVSHRDPDLGKQEQLACRVHVYSISAAADEGGTPP